MFKRLGEQNKVPNKADTNCDALFEAYYVMKSNMPSILGVASLVLVIVLNIEHAHYVFRYLQQPYEVGINYHLVL